MCKTEDGAKPSKTCIFPFFYAELNPEDNDYVEIITEFQGCVKDRSRGLWCPTKTNLLKNQITYVEGLDDRQEQDWGLCSPGCIEHGYE